jgi:hypothetical protein
MCMKRISSLGLCLMAAVALCAATAASAVAAAPDYGKCTKVAKGAGKMSNATCTAEKVGGSYEWEALKSPVAFATTMPAGTFATLETVRKEKVVCTGGETGTGNFLNGKEVEITTTLRGCDNGKVKCSTVGQGTGTVAMSPLQGELGVEKRGATASGNKLASNLYAQGNRGGQIVDISCGGFFVKVQGTVLFPVTANKMLATTTVKVTATKGRQKPEKFEGGPKEVLEASFGGWPFEQTGLTVTRTQTNSEPVEANTVF